MDVPYWSQGSGVAKDHYVNVNEFIPARFQKWIQYNKASNWKAVNEVFENKFRAITKELWYNNGNAQIVFAWLFTIWSHGVALPTLLLPHYYHTIEIRTIESTSSDNGVWL